MKNIIKTINIFNFGKKSSLVQKYNLNSKNFFSINIQLLGHLFSDRKQRDIHPQVYR
jgi:hypothetical protein